MENCLISTSSQQMSGKFNHNLYPAILQENFNEIYEKLIRNPIIESQIKLLGQSSDLTTNDISLNDNNTSFTTQQLVSPVTQFQDQNITHSPLLPNSIENQKSPITNLLYQEKIYIQDKTVDLENIQHPQNGMLELTSKENQRHNTLNAIQGIEYTDRFSVVDINNEDYNMLFMHPTNDLPSSPLEVMNNKSSLEVVSSINYNEEEIIEGRTNQGLNDISVLRSEDEFSTTETESDYENEYQSESEIKSKTVQDSGDESVHMKYKSEQYCPLKGCFHNKILFKRHSLLQKHCFSAHTPHGKIQTGMNQDEVIKLSHILPKCYHDMCGRFFSRSDSLARHTKRVHGRPGSRFNIRFNNSVKSKGNSCKVGPKNRRIIKRERLQM